MCAQQQGPPPFAAAASASERRRSSARPTLQGEHESLRAEDSDSLLHKGASSSPALLANAHDAAPGAARLVGGAGGSLARAAHWLMWCIAGLACVALLMRASGRSEYRNTGFVKVQGSQVRCRGRACGFLSGSLGGTPGAGHAPGRGHEPLSLSSTCTLFYHPSPRRSLCSTAAPSTWPASTWTTLRRPPTPRLRARLRARRGAPTVARGRRPGCAILHRLLRPPCRLPSLP